MGEREKRDRRKRPESLVLAENRWLTPTTALRKRLRQRLLTTLYTEYREPQATASNQGTITTTRAEGPWGRKPEELWTLGAEELN